CGKGDVADALPVRARRGAAWRPARDFHAGARVDAKVLVRRLDHHALGGGAEKIPSRRALGRPRTDFHAVRDQFLAVAAARLQPQRAAGEADLAVIAIGRDVTDVVDHARP